MVQPVPGFNLHLLMAVRRRSQMPVDVHECPQTFMGFHEFPLINFTFMVVQRCSLILGGPGGRERCKGTYSMFIAKNAGGPGRQTGHRSLATGTAR